MIWRMFPLFFRNLILLQCLAYDKRKNWPSKTSLETWLCRLNKFVWTKLAHDSSNIGCSARRYALPRWRSIRIDLYRIQFVRTRSNLNAPFCIQDIMKQQVANLIFTFKCHLIYEFSLHHLKVKNKKIAHILL